VPRLRTTPNPALFPLYDRLPLQARCRLDGAMPARQLEARAISPESGKGVSRKNDCESSRIAARSVRLMRPPMTMRIAINAAALGAMVWLVGAASSSAQDRPAPDCLLTYADGQLCGRTSIHEAFKCVAFLRAAKMCCRPGPIRAWQARIGARPAGLRSFRADACSWTR
jgi:hypothetical protein